MAQRSKTKSKISSVPIRSGSMVNIIGLSKRPDLNHKTGLLIAFHSKKQRWQVLEPKTGTPFLLKPENIIGNDPILKAVSKFSADSACHEFVANLRKEFEKSVQKIGRQQISPNLCLDINKLKTESHKLYRNVATFLKWII